MIVNLYSSLPSSATYNGTVKKLRFRVVTSDTGNTVYVSFNGETEVVLQQNTYIEPDKPILGFCLYADRFKLPPIVRYPVDTDIYCNFADSDTLTLWFIQDTRDTPTDLTLELYKNKSELNSINKDIELVSTLTGFLREACGIISPSIVVEISTLPEFNYVYIPNFHRYYFVGNVVSVNKTLWRIDLRVDVLMSYRLSIYKQTGLIGRQEFDYNDDLVDNERLVETEFTVSKYEIPCDLFDLGSSQWNVTAEQHAYNKNVVITTAQWSQAISPSSQYYEYANKGEITTRPKGNVGQKSKFNTSYITNLWGLRDVQEAMIQGNFSTSNIFNNPSEFILSMRVYPFVLTDWVEVYPTQYPDTELDNNIGVGSSQISTGAPVGYTYSQKVDICKNRYIEYDIPRYFNDFMDFAPYTTIKLYIPYINTVDLPVNEVIGKTIRIWFNLDFNMGVLYCNVEVKESDNTYHLILTTSNKIGVDLPIGRTNATERARNDEVRRINNVAGVVKIGLGVVGSIASVATGKPLGIVGGVGLATKTISSGVSLLADNKIQNVTNNQETYSGGQATGEVNPSYLPITPYLLIKRPIPIPIDENYNHLKGRPLGEYRTLGVLQGFTIVDDIHLKEFDSATDSEVNQIEQLLRTGVQL